MSIELTFKAQSDIGRERSENQDAYGNCTVGEYEFFIVCDGMGGHAGGSTASRMGVVTIEEQLAEIDAPLRDKMRRAIEEANTRIYSKAQRQRELRNMGTTVVLLGVDTESGTATVAHVGDSRIYRYRDGTLRQLTKDHTMVQRLIDDGILTPEAAENHPNANVISRSLGGREDVDVEFNEEEIELEDGDIFLLCSDGLSGLVRDPEIGRVMADMPPDEAVPHLIERALEEGGYDNVTIEIVLVGEQKPAPEEITVVHPPITPRERPDHQPKPVDMPGKDDGEVDLKHSQVRNETVALEAFDADAIDEATAEDRGAESDADADGDDATPPSGGGRNDRPPPVSELDEEKGAGFLVIAVALIVIAAILLVNHARREPTAAEQSPSEGSAAVPPAPAPENADAAAAVSADEADADGSVADEDVAETADGSADGRTASMEGSAAAAASGSGIALRGSGEPAVIPTVRAGSGEQPEAAGSGTSSVDEAGGGAASGTGAEEAGLPSEGSAGSGAVPPSP